jgi:heat shock protein HslJ
MPALAILVVAVGCGGTSNSAQPGTRTPPKVGVVGHTYLSTAVSGHTLVRGTRITLTFDDKTLSANAGCNSLSGSYRVDGDRLVADQLGGTDMGCDPPRHAQDEWVAQLLQSKPVLAGGADTITLRSGTTTLTLRDREVVHPDKPLLGTTWVVDTIIEHDVASSVPAGTPSTILLPSRTRIEVYDGCNRTSGAVEVGDRSLTVVDLPESVRTNCQGPAGVVFASVLRGTVQFTIEGDRLTLTGPQGRGFGLHAQAG